MTAKLLDSQERERQISTATINANVMTTAQHNLLFLDSFNISVATFFLIIQYMFKTLSDDKRKLRGRNRRKNTKNTKRGEI